MIGERERKITKLVTIRPARTPEFLAHYNLRYASCEQLTQF